MSSSRQASQTKKAERAASQPACGQPACGQHLPNTGSGLVFCNGPQTPATLKPCSAYPHTALAHHHAARGLVGRRRVQPFTPAAATEHRIVAGQHHRRRGNQTVRIHGLSRCLCAHLHASADVLRLGSPRGHANKTVFPAVAPSDAPACMHPPAQAAEQPAHHKPAVVWAVGRGSPHVEKVRAGAQQLGPAKQWPPGDRHVNLAGKKNKKQVGTSVART